jgi:hypothetical protein
VGRVDQVCPPEGEEGTTRPWDPGWKDHDRWVHALLAALDSSISFIRSLEVHDQEMRLSFFTLRGYIRIQLIA